MPTSSPDPIRARQRERALNPPTPKPDQRRLRVYAYDPTLGSQLRTFRLNEAIQSVRWEPLAPGPVGEYLEVIDVDPASRACYAPVDLQNPYLIAQDGLEPSETDPRFHQQMVYAVASRTIELFERALGRVALWAPRALADQSLEYVQRLRIYPHALRDQNAFYSPSKKALLLGYFNALPDDPQDNTPGALVFACLSHDIVAHETTHALLDGLHRRYTEATNPDVLAFHEGFADLVALFQHFSLPEALRFQISEVRGDLRRQTLLGQLAVQFGHATGGHGALRDAIGGYDADGTWRPHQRSTTDYPTAQAAGEPHALGAILVAAVFDAFLQIYAARTEDLIRIATGGTGVLTGAPTAELVERLADEAAKAAGHVLDMCIRALDYCPPVDITFSDYLRAIVTADTDLAPQDPFGYRIAFVEAFRARGITPADVRSVSASTLVWEPPPLPLSGLKQILRRMKLHWDAASDRRKAYDQSNENAKTLWHWLQTSVSDDELAVLGLVRDAAALTFKDDDGTETKGSLHRFEVHSLRPARRIGPDRTARNDLIVEITQSWHADDASLLMPVFRAGCTLVIDLDAGRASYLVRKRAKPGRFFAQTAFQAAAALGADGTYFDPAREAEPFAALHRGEA